MTYRDWASRMPLWERITLAGTRIRVLRATWNTTFPFTDKRCYDLAMEPLVTVIVPTFNNESTILRTLRSIQSHDLEALEILIVDDGSGDQTVEVCEAARETDPRIRIHRIGFNGGVFQARRVGADLAGGKCVMFCDADDELTTYAAYRSASQAEEGNYDIVHFGMSIISATGSRHQAWERSLKPFASEASGDAILLRSPYGVPGQRINGTVCNKLYRLDLVKRAWRVIARSLRLERAEDIFQTLLLLNEAHRYSGLQESLYHYHFGAGRSGNTSPNRETFLHYLEATSTYHAIQEHLSSPYWEGPAEFDSQDMLDRLKTQLIENQLNYWFRLQTDSVDSLRDLLSRWSEGALREVTRTCFADRLGVLEAHLDRLANAS